MAMRMKNNISTVYGHYCMPLLLFNARVMLCNNVSDWSVDAQCMPGACLSYANQGRISLSRQRVHTLPVDSSKAGPSHTLSQQPS